jgi:Spy/CpxP family protein refolding chaperone
MKGRIFRALLFACVSLGVLSRAFGQQARPTLRFVIPQIEQTRAAQATLAARPSPTPDMSAYWWNQPDLIESLELSEEQRREMDAVMREAQRQMNESVHKQNAARDRFEVAIRKRDWKEAREAAAAWEAGFAQQWGVANRSKIDIFEKLTPEQHEKLLRDHEYLLHRPWTLGHRTQFRVGTPATPSSPTPKAER